MIICRSEQVRRKSKDCLKRKKSKITSNNIQTMIKSVTYQGHVKSSKVSNRHFSNENHSYVWQIDSSLCFHMTPLISGDAPQKLITMWWINQHHLRLCDCRMKQKGRTREWIQLKFRYHRVDVRLINSSSCPNSQANIFNSAYGH